MSEPQDGPDWDTPLTIALTPDDLMHTLFAMADEVHTGHESCVDPKLLCGDVSALDRQGDNYCRMAEQEYVEDDSPEVTWHDWAVELKVGATYITGHWRAQVGFSRADWECCARQSARAFRMGCVLMGQNVREGLTIEARHRPAPGGSTRH